MSAPLTSESSIATYTGLTELKSGLPAAWYYDERHHEIELARIWYRNWIYVARSSEISGPRAYMTFALGRQQLLLVRDEEGVLQGFHNTCRHRGAALCTEPQGVLRSSAVVCPYHAWVYGLKGDLLRTSSKSTPAGFALEDFSLYRIKVAEWRGFIFVCLGDDAPSLSDTFGHTFGRLERWPLEELAVAHVMTKTMECNWKIFWENFSECLHCPGVHPKLSQLVPIFGRGIVRERDDPNWKAHADDQNPLYKGGLRAGAASWSMDGSATGSIFPGLTEEDRALGQVYMTGRPSTFFAAHVDYVRTVRIYPLGPERTELRIEYLFAPEALAAPGFNPRNVVEFADLVMSEDAHICEINQRGLRSIRHSAGVLMPEEYMVHSLHEWLHAQM
ncbi:MAG TPA: aromatic ring-hydroxylating dioxygenase subunit alpha [Steroidobacteraceae bacterium]